MWLDRIIQTLASWLVSEQKRSLDPAARLAAAGESALAKATELWLADIYDPQRKDTGTDAAFSRKHIDSMIRNGLGWTWEPPYAGDGAFEWCGAFAATCWPGIKPDLRKTYFASTYRLDRYARGGSVNGEKNAKGERLLIELDEHSDALPEARPGDILTIGPAGSGYGKHICIVENVAGNIISTLEGNGTGLGPDFKRRQGVVRGKRALGMRGMKALAATWHARRLIRPAPDDLL